MAGRIEEILKIAILNGPNLNLLGTREPSLYGSVSLREVESRLEEVALELNVQLVFEQHNGEGELISAVHRLAKTCDGAVINAGAYTHTSLALRDAFTGTGLRFVEVHITNVYAREPERRHSMLAPAAVATLGGFGPVGYELALLGLVSTLVPEGG